MRVLRKKAPTPTIQGKTYRDTLAYIYIVKYLPTHAMTIFYCFPAAPQLPSHLYIDDGAGGQTIAGPVNRTGVVTSLGGRVG